jgi:AcrR family transcriptional regulator
MAMTGSPQSRPAVVSGGRRRLPAQARSQARVQRLLDAAAELVDLLGPEAVTTTMIAARASVSVGWLYDFFEDRDAIFDAVIARSIDQLGEVIEEAHRSYDNQGWQVAISAVIDALVHFYRTQPGFRSIWFSSYLNATMLEVNRTNDEALAARGVERLRRSGLVADDVELTLPMLMVTAIVDKGLDLAFRRDECGDADVIEETKRSVHAYLGGYLD